MKKLHLILALSVGILFVVLGISGSFLVFRAEMRQAATPSLEAFDLDAEILDADQMVAKLSDEYNHFELRSVVLPRRHQDPYVLSFRYEADGEHPLEKLFVDPTTGETKPVVQHQSLLEAWIYQLHANLFLSARGNQLVGFTGLFSLVLIILGLMVWGRTLSGSGLRGLKKSLWVPRQAKGNALLSALHKVSGLYLSPLLILLAMTGAMLVFRENVIDPLETSRQAVSLTKNHGDKPSKTCVRMAGIEDYIYEAESIFPEAIATFVQMPRRAGRPVEVTLRHTGEVSSPLGLTKVMLDPGCGQVLKVLDGRNLSVSQSLTEIIVALHNGSFFGPAGRVLYIILGLTPLFSFITGTLFWLRKKRRKTLADKALQVT